MRKAFLTPSSQGANFAIIISLQADLMSIEREMQDLHLFGYALRQDNRELFEK
jgi:hypothetical protein